MLSLALGLGLLFLHFYTSYAGHATALLFGNVLGVQRSTVWIMLAMGLLALLPILIGKLRGKKVRPGVGKQ